MIVEFPRGRVRHASEADAMPEPKRLSPGMALRLVLLLSLALWAAIWALVGMVVGQ